MPHLDFLPFLCPLPRPGGGDNVKYTSLVDKIFFKINDDSHELIVFDHKSKEAMQQVAVIAQKLYFLSYLFINWL